MGWIRHKRFIVLVSGAVFSWANLAPAQAHVSSSHAPPVPISLGYTPAFKKIHIQPVSRNIAIIKDLNAKMVDLPPPYIFELARRTFDSDPKEALILFWLGTLRAHTDATKCTDRSVLQSIRYWQNFVPRIVKMLKIYPQSSQQAKLIAIERDKAFLTDSSPRWICFSGKAAARAKAENRDFEFWHQPRNEWRSLRKQIRLNMLKSARKSLK